MAGRYVKIAFTTNWGDSLTCMDTLHVCDADGVKWNNENMTHTTGGGLVNGDPKNCSDATAGNYWQTSTRPNWWKVDLGQTRQISKVKTKVLGGYATRNIKAFTVSVSDDDTNWTEILSTETANSDSEQTFDTSDTGDQAPVNYLSSARRDRMRTKGISLGARTPSDRNTSFLIARHNRLRVDGVSLENVYPSYPGILSLLLSVPAVPTVTSSTSKIEETPIAIEADDLDTLEVPAVPTVTPGATVYTYTDDGECTISIASPAEITLAGHGLAANHEVYFKTSGALPTGIVQYTHYYVKSPAEDTFNISAAAGGAAINTSGSQSGTHKLWTKD